MHDGPFSVGEVLGDNYEIRALLGTGGMGAVYEAHDGLLQRQVAIKAPLEQRDVVPLRNEARALAAVRHPGLVTVYAAGRHRGVDYVVLELVRGKTLEHYIEDALRAGRTLPVDEVVELLAAITDGLCALHSLGMAHRDLKPANVILNGARAVLVDFGLFIPEFEVSGDNAVAGSPEYVAPEVLLRNVEPGAGPLVDLYALGMLAYELLVGRPPFAGASPPAIVSRHLGVTVPDVRDRRGDVPPKLAGLIAELVAKEPTDRPPSSEAVLWRLSELRGHSPADAHDLRVLVIDDDPGVGAALTAALETAMPGLEVRAMTDPREAVASIERDPPDVVAVDLNMPWLNGVEVVMRLDALPRERRPAIVAMSARASGRDVEVLRALGVHSFVPKDHRFVAAVCDAIGALRRLRAQGLRVARTMRAAVKQTSTHS